MRPLMNPVHFLFNQSHQKTILSALLTAAMLLLSACGGSNGDNANGNGDSGSQSNPPVLTVPSDAFVFAVGIPSINTVAGSGAIPTSCSITNLPAGLTATGADNGCAISGTATAPSAQSSYTLTAINNDGTSTITIDLSVIIVPPVLAVPSDAFVFLLDVASSNTVAGSGSAPTSCSIAGLPAGLTATVAGNGCAISGTATTPLAQSSYILSASNAAGTSTTTIAIEILIPVDRDANGLIELYTLRQLHNMRYNLNGDSYKTSTADTGSTVGCPDAGCNGYELMNDVDFDADGDGQTWTQDSSGNYSLDSGDSGDSAAPYFVIDSSGSGGWQPVGDSENNAFNAIFDGNGYVIRNLAIRSELTNIGLFGVTAANAIIRNVGLVNNLSDYTGSSNGLNYVGGLVGYQFRGSITASYATGNADGGDGNSDRVGGLVGFQNSGSITGSYATGDADGGAGGSDRVGGLVGYQQFGSISASYATGNADGGAGGQDYVGGLVGRQSFRGNIVASYATGNADGGAGDGDTVGGLVGQQQGSITGSYATGNADGGYGNGDTVGGLVGFQQGGSIRASYATGDADGGDGFNDRVGGLVGYQEFGSIRSSYATGNADGGAGFNDRVGGLVAFQNGGSISASYATGNADGGAGDGDTVGGLVGGQNSGSITGSYATGNADGGAGFNDRVGGLVGAQNGGITASYSFGSKVGGEFAGSDGTPMPTGVTSAAGLMAANVGSSWNSANDGTLGAWDFGGSAQPPAVVFNDYDGVSTGTDYAALFAGYTTLTALIPNQRPASSPQIGTATTDIQLNDGDTANSISGNIDLPTAFNGENLTWSIFYDPAQTDSQVSVDDNNRVQINVAHRTARTFILRAVDSNSNIVNDYHLRIIDEDDTAIVLTAPSEAFVFGVDVASTNTVAGSGGIPTSCSIADLPLGLTATVVGNGCAISGTATAPSPQSSYTLTASNAAGTATVTIDLSVIRQPFLTTPSDAFVFAVGIPSINTVAGSGGIPTSCSIVGLPAGLTATVAGNGCAISGTATATSALSSYTLSASNDDGTSTITIDLSIIAPPVLTAPSEAFIFALDVASTNTIVGSSGSTPTSCSIADLPAGLTATVAGNGCAISGTATATSAQRSYTLSASNDDGTTTITIEIQIPVDRDGNGLIELYTLTQLHNMRYNLRGSSYKTGTAGTGSWVGCPNGGCNGYELMNDLDFDADGDGQSWTQDSSGNYSLDSGDSAAPYFVIDSSGSGGWQPIGNSVRNAFNAVFDGNGYVIRNLAIRRELTNIGLFGFTAANAIIRNVGLVNNLSDYTGSSNDENNVGGLVGRQNGGSITGSYATGNADGGAGTFDYVGGLVGYQFRGSISASYATGNADGGAGTFDYVGGLVGRQNRGSITASYATGNADGGAGGSDLVGGLVGFQGSGGSITASYATGDADGGGSVGGLVGRQQSGGSITASYATGNADGGDGNSDRVGGLVGYQGFGGSITGSYATGNADGGDGNSDRVGGLVGYQQEGSIITASYATGNADGGAGFDDRVGGLVGYQDSGSIITASYATGNADGGDGISDYVGGLVGYQDSGSIITASYATGDADGGDGGSSYVGGLVGAQARGGSITASYATGNADGGAGGGGRVGGLVGWQGSGGSITASYATGNADGGDGNSDRVGGLVGDQLSGSIRASYATGNADGGDGNTDRVGGLVGRQNGAGSITASYSFGSKVGGEFAGSDGTPMPTGVNSATDLTAANVGSSWNSASSSTLGAWDFGGSAQPPAVVFNDYDGANIGTDYAALFAGYTTLTALIPNQRPASSPQIGTATTDIRLNGGDTANSISGNIDLPATFNGENLTWSVFYDPAPTVSQVSVDDNNRVQINAAHRTTARTFILRARDSNGNIVNDYHLRIIQISPPVLTTPSNAFVFAVDVASSNTVAGSGGTPASCSIANLPAGLTVTVAGNGCAISGTATTPSAQSSYTLSASNDDGASTVRISLSAVIVPPVLTVPSDAFIFALDVASTNTVAGSGGAPASCSIAGLPAGLTATVAGNGCAISGTATAPSAQSSYTLSASNDHGMSTVTISLSIIIVPPVLAVPSDAFVFTLDVASSNTFAGSGSAPTSCSIAGLPAGLTATVAGNGCAISGTATTPLAQSSYILSASNAAGTTTTTISIAILPPVDRDANGLIELYTLTQLHNMRYNLSGSSYKTSTADTGSTAGCPNDACIGYELMNDLDFDTDGDGTWTQDSSGNYSLNTNDSATPYFVVNADGTGGWLPVGDSTNAFNTIFDGNGYVIRNLAIRSELTNIGLFGVTTANASIRNVGLVNNLSDYTGNSDSFTYIGGLVGYQFRGSITASYATGNADGGAGGGDTVGGLVGRQDRGSITGSYATGNADGGAGGGDSVGGLVGWQNGAGSITASYATGDADGGAGRDRVGGLVGWQNGAGSITASYATGDADGGDGDEDYVGGLVGRRNGTLDQAVFGLVVEQAGSITASYATGDADGGAGDGDYVGGLVGWQDYVVSRITASYATGNADGGDGTSDYVGGLVGRQFGNRRSISASYSFGSKVGGEIAGSDGTPMPTGVIWAARLTASNVGSSWNSANDGTLGAWDFGGGAQPPALVFNDYDGVSTGTDYAALFAGYTTLTALIPNQRPASSPQIGTATTDIQLNDGDTANSISGNIDLPATFNGENLTWSVFYDPAPTVSQVSVDDNNRVQINAAHRTTARTFILRARDSRNNIVNDYHLRIIQINPPVLTVPSDAFVFTLDVASTNTIAGSGGAPASCSIAGLPAGLTATVAGNGCAISGTATATSALSSYTLSASNNDGTATITIDLSVIDPPVLTVPSDAFVFTLDVASTNTVAGSGGTPASCSIANLPAGLTATVAGNGCAISGTVTAYEALSSYTLIASNDDGTTTITIDLSVIAPPVLTVPSDAFVFAVGVASTNTIVGSSGTPASCSIANLPAGLTATVAGNGCAISGTATTLLAQSSYTLSASNTAGTTTTTISIAILPPVDRDANGLIELYTLTQLHNMRYNLSGSSYKTGTADTGSTVGCPDAGCNGYELMNDLDFDTDGDGQSWTQDNSGNYSLDSGDSAAPYFVIDPSGSGGWQPVGNSTNNAFNAIFDGNGYVIRNLAIRSELTNIGLFGVTTANAIIRNVGLVNNLSDYTGSSFGVNRVGGLVGQQFGGSITGSYATGNADGGAGSNDLVGGLVGGQNGAGSIRASYATGNADGGDGRDRVGGLVGWQSGSITASYATGIADGGDGPDNTVGGLVGYQGSGGSITASYATGNADGGAGDQDEVGGLVGWQDGGSITASYATGNADGGAGNRERVGGLVGWQRSGSIRASYATGNADGGAGDQDTVGGLVGYQEDRGSIRASYATGNADGGDGNSDRVGGLVGYQDSGSIITASYATGNADGGDGDQDRVGGLVGFQQFGISISSYSFGSKVGGEIAGRDGTPRPTGFTSADLTAANAGGSWNSANYGTLGAWDFGGGAQPPAVVFNDYDGAGTGTDYAALFAGYTTLTALIPNQRPASSPQIGTATTDIQLNDGDTANSISGNIDLPTAFNGENLTWSVFYDPAPTVSQVSVDNTNSVQVNAAHRTTARTFILRARDSRNNIVNDYHLRIIDEDGTAIVLTAPSEAFVFTLDVASTNTIVGSSGSTPTSCSIAGLPAGLTATVAGNGCAISGTATTPLAQSSYTLTASNAAGTATVTIDLSVIGHPVLTTPSEAFIFALDVASSNTVVGSGSAPTSCSIANLPAGLTATVAGNGCAISGTATTPLAQSSYILSASNAAGTATVTIDLSVIGHPVLTTPSEAFIFALDVASSNTVVGSGSAPTSCSIAGLPAGLTATVVGNGCAISGTATTPLAQRSYTLSASNDDGTTTITIEIQIPVDRDGNGLIELYTLTQLHNMRYNLSGSSYKTHTAGTGSTAGCPNTGCNGYELMNDLDFDTDGDGQTWSQDSSGNYSLDSGDSAAPYFVIDSSGSGGWQPIGNSVSNAFNAVFDGNGYVIRNLAIRRELTYIGLFGVTAANAIIRNVGLVNNLSDYTGSSNGFNPVGGLVGFQNGGSITGSYATGNADGGDGNSDRVGGLVGVQFGSIRASYATGNADGGDGGQDYVGGLVGSQGGGGSITASYATGNADGGDGNTDRVGGLVGDQFSGSITASYATGNADGGDGSSDRVGGLVGRQFGGSITGSYSFGSKVGGENAGIDGTGKPTGVNSAAGLTAANVGSSWNSANDGTLGAWDFGGGAQPPALVFNDYDGVSTGTDYAALFAGYTTLTALIPNQRPASSPQIGTATTDIQLNDGDTANSISGNIDLPTAFNGENLTWSVFYDPAPTVSQVSVDNTNSVQVNAAHRTTARTFILRARDSRNNIVNDYHLRIIE